MCPLVSERSVSKVKTFFELIKFEHTLFALPFAYLGMVMAQKRWPSWSVFFLVTVAMASARTAGMTLNRLIDRGIDARNPRTKNRAILTGQFQASWAWILVGISVLILVLSAWALNPLCLKLSPVALIFLTGYHYAKRMTWGCHWILGSVLAIAPVGGWLAVTGVVSLQAAPLALAVLFWVAGFDILYSLQDMDFDKASGLHSAPVRFGLTRALTISYGCHVATLIFLILFGLLTGVGAVYGAGVLITALLLRFEHVLVADGDLTKLNTAFFTINGWVGILLFIFILLEVYR